MTHEEYMKLKRKVIERIDSGYEQVASDETTDDILVDVINWCFLAGIDELLKLIEEIPDGPSRALGCEHVKLFRALVKDKVGEKWDHLRDKKSEVANDVS